MADLVQNAEPARKVQTLIESLAAYIDITSIPDTDGCSKVQCLYDASEVLVKVREEFKREPARSKQQLADIVKSILAPPRKKYYISLEVRLLVFQSGRSNLMDLLGKDGEDDCIVLLPVIITGPAEATVNEPATSRQTTFMFEVGSELIIAGRCSIRVEPQSKVVCVALCIGRDKD